MLVGFAPRPLIFSRIWNNTILDGSNEFTLQEKDFRVIRTLSRDLCPQVRRIYFMSLNDYAQYQIVIY